MNSRLTLHADSVCPSVDRIDAELNRQHSELSVRYVLTGVLADLKIPPRTAPSRADDLWRHTCFEMFLGTTDSNNYFEFNFSPSTRWAAYRFSRYREDRVAADEINAVRMDIRESAGTLVLSTAIDVGKLGLQGSVRIGLSAVIEEMSGRISYWALAHPPGKPDFHHGTAFVPLADSLS